MKNVRHLIAIASLSLLATGANAASLCTFTTECYEDQPCQATAFSLRFGAGTGGPNELELTTDAETIGVAVGGTSTVAYLAGMTESGFHVLTVMNGTGEARYTNHIGPDGAGNGPQTVSYLGKCELRK